ncbi:MAG: translation initiation factor IF-2 subunit beta [Candidatus Aenigmarchaeota archaeon]|nr:translation initiation factor IF-2 subunit beta [Candidatus Aenigmarchaeota archaeon]
MSIATYEELLDKGLAKVPQRLKEGSRLVIPQAGITRAGQRTFINNFFEIADTLRRDSKHLLKFLLKEFATKGEIEGKRLSLLGTFSDETVRKKIEIYVMDYVACKECKKPDTKLVREGEYYFVVCEACGARHPAGD